MSIADKLITIAENQPKLYEKGKSDFGVTFDESATNLVAIENVHPKEHDVEVLTDAEGVTVFGKNLFDISRDNLPASYHAGLTMTMNDDGSFNLAGTLTANYRYIYDYVADLSDSIWAGYTIPAGTKITMSSQFESDVSTDCIGIVIRRPGEDGSTTHPIIIQGNSLKNGQKLKHTLQYDGKTVEYCFRFPDRAAGDYVEIRNIKLQCEIGSVDEPVWEAFKGGRYPVTDGKATVKSVSPAMNITADTTDVNIEAIGYLDGQAVIDEITQALVDLGGEI